VKIVDCAQNSPEWDDARRGLLTASEFKTIIGAKKDAKDKLTRAKYLRKLAGERITGEPSKGFTNAAMERGHEMEDRARARYTLETGFKLARIGFVTDDKGTVGASPDSFVDGCPGGAEFKTAEPHILIEHIERAIRDPLYFPAEHVAQCQGNLWVCEREWIDIAIFWPGLPLFVKRAFRDEAYIAELRAAVDDANAEIEAIIERVNSYLPEAA
jgi:hypothetical protein